jgi:hypothetical protein
MRYRVDYWRGASREKAYERYVYVEDLPSALDKAWEDAWYARRYHQADGFRIIDLHDGDAEAAAASFEGATLPLPPYIEA